MSGYLESLQQAQSDHKLSLEKRDRLSHNLTQLVPQAIECIDKAEHYLKKTQEIIGNTKIN